MPDPETIAPLPLSERRRVVAVVGRPNVGKSAIFNRIASRRIAIVHDQSGVTRDRLVRQVSWRDQSFELVDTGGVNLAAVEAHDSIGEGIIEQVRVALDDAAVAILVVDVQAGLTPVDEEVARMVRKSGVPCRVAVNKCDLPQHEAGVPEFEKLAFPLYPVSAQHDRGMEALMADVVSLLPDTKDESVANPIKVAIVGRPNAGKSSYINRLLRQPRVIVSEVAGTTRDCIEVPFSIGVGDHVRHYKLIDTAGMRHVHRIDSAVERFSHFRSEQAVRDADVVVLVLDAEVGPTTQDKHIAALVTKENKSCVILVNKWDMAHDRLDETQVTETKYEPALRETMPFMSHCPVVFISAKSGYNVRRSIEVIDEVASQIHAKLSTGLLNRVVGEAMARINPPSRGAKHLKVFYATQTGTAPVRVRLFVNDAKIPTAHFSAYIVRSLRASFGLEGTPVVVNYRERVRPDEDARGTSAPAGDDGEDVEAAPKRRAAKRTSASRTGRSETKRAKSPSRKQPSRKTASRKPLSRKGRKK